MRVLRLKPIIDIAIPSDFLAESPDNREAIRKIGYIGRGAAIFQVSRIIVYRHRLAGDRDKAQFIIKNLGYLSTPPYLRKDLFKLDKDLKYVGLLPPLKTPNHAPEGKPQRGEYREGIVIKWDGYYSIVKIGDGIYAKIPRPMPLGTRVIVQIDAPTTRDDTYRAHVVPRDRLSIYWGFESEIMDVSKLFDEYIYVILTGKEGISIKNAIEQINDFLSGDRFLVVFGSPYHGVDEILRAEGMENTLKKYPFINFIPGQGVETVRTEEAVIAVLSILNLIRHLHGSLP
ncbi:MAG: putative RNA uridine N3 methyltransferase [Vulcanisaeta sp.]|uniref:putative RNA uridine N3 methyltransferase n=1 Tax=Vulcanisaeta sp. TaxID=2020871 RepID=UPI003D0FEC31